MTLFQTTRRTRSCGPARRSLQISGASIRPAPLSLLLFLSALFASMATVLGASAPSDSGDTLGVTHDNDMQVLAADSASTRYFYGGKATAGDMTVGGLTLTVSSGTAGWVVFKQDSTTGFRLFESSDPVTVEDVSVGGKYLFATGVCGGNTLTVSATPLDPPMDTKVFVTAQSATDTLTYTASNFIQSTDGTVVPSGVTGHPFDEAYAFGKFQGSIDFGDGISDVSPSGLDAGYLVRYDRDMKPLQYASVTGGTGDAVINDVFVRTFESLVVVGNFHGPSVDFAGLTSTGHGAGEHGFVAEVHAKTLAVTTIRVINSNLGATVTCVTGDVGPSGQFAVGGAIGTAPEVDNTALGTVAGSANREAYVAIFSSTFVATALKSGGSLGEDEMVDIVYAGGGGMAIVYGIAKTGSGDVTWPGESATTGLAGDEHVTFLALKEDVGGTGVWDATFSGTYSATATGRPLYPVALTPKMLVVNTMGTVDFGTNSVSATATTKFTPFAVGMSTVGVPPAPLPVIAIGDPFATDSLSLRWHPDRLSGSSVSGYDIQINTGGGFGDLGTDAVGPLGVFDYGPLSDTTSYQFKIKSLDAGMWSPSPWPSFSTSSPPVGNLIGPFAVVPRANGFYITWEGFPGQPSSVLWYDKVVVEYVENGEAAATSTSVGTRYSPEITIDDLQPSTTYDSITLRMANFWDHEQTAGTTISGPFNTPAGDPLEMPQASVTVFFVTNTGFRLDWEGVPDGPAGIPVIGYVVEHSVDSGTNWVTETQTSDTWWEVTGLSASTEYHYRVLTVNDVMTTTPSWSSALTTLSSAPPSPRPIMTGIASNADEQVTVSFGATPTDFTSYQLFRNEYPGGPIDKLVGTISETPQTFSVPGNANFDFQAVATNAAGDAPSDIFEDVFVATTNNPDPPVQVSWLVENDKLTIEVDHQGLNGGSMELYFATVSLNDKAHELAFVEFTTATRVLHEITITGDNVAAGGIDVEVLVYVQTDLGRSVSLELTGTTPNDGSGSLPTAPPSPFLFSAGPDSVVIVWNLPQDYDNGGSPIISFDIGDSGQTAIATINHEDPWEYTTPSDLVAGEDYTFYLNVQTSVGYSGWSPPLNFNFDGVDTDLGGGAAPDQPPPPFLTSAGPDSVMIEWGLPGDYFAGGAAIVSFDIGDTNKNPIFTRNYADEWKFPTPSNLVIGNEYEFFLRVQTADQMSDWSPPLHFVFNGVNTEIDNGGQGSGNGGGGQSPVLPFNFVSASGQNLEFSWPKPEGIVVVLVRITMFNPLPNPGDGQVVFEVEPDEDISGASIFVDAPVGEERLFVLLFAFEDQDDAVSDPLSIIIGQGEVTPPVDCSSFTSCGACTSTPECGMCFRLQAGAVPECLEARPNGTPVLNGAPSCSDGFYVDQCPAAADCPNGQTFCSFTGACQPSSDSCGGCPIVTCPNGDCKDSVEECNCPPGQQRCPAPDAHMCVNDLETCGTQCPGNLPVRCESGDCVASPGECACPDYLPVKCDSGLCAEDAAACTAECPATRPVKCWDNACVSSFDQCSCPPTDPVRCAAGTANSGRCVVSADTCDVTCPAGQVSCHDGSCASNLGQCPCPPNAPHRCASGLCTIDPAKCDETCAPPQVRCPDSSCANDFTECGCPSATPVRCDNSLCAASSADCSATCPNVRCWDSSCADSFDACPCPAAQPVKCPNGRCAASSTECGAAQCSGPTPVTCWDSSCAADASRCTCPPHIPFRCANRLCASSAAACEASCPASAPVRCWNSECKADPGQCPCSPDLPFRCPSGRCEASASSCSSTGFCPADRPAPCWDGSCAKSPDSCRCAPDLPFRCDDGKCAPGPDSCSVVVSSCKRDYPNKCDFEFPANWSSMSAAEKTAYRAANGQRGCVRCSNRKCETSEDKCIQVNSVCPADWASCPDGSCQPTFAQCRQVQFCPNFECPDKTCVMRPSECPSSTACPPDRSFKCADGQCAADPAVCSQPRLCPPGLVRCADQSCSVSHDECPQTPICPEGQVMCEDLVCRKNVGACEAAIERVAGFGGGVRCPPPNDKRCPDGSCSNNLDNCPTLATCPPGDVKCPDNSCRRFVEECNIVAGCPPRQIECPGGGCAVLPTNVTLAPTFNCPTRLSCPTSHPILCPDGSCETSLANCAAVGGCGARDIKCADGTCVPAGAYPAACPIEPKCPASVPTRCGDGSCKASIDACPSPTQTKCPAGQVRCPSGSCSHSRALCPAPPTCPQGMTMCWDKTCVTDLDLCPEFVERCGAGEIECPDSSCRTSIADCPTEPVCPVCPGLRLPARCAADGSCRASADQCPPPVSACPAGKIQCPMNKACVDSPSECGVRPICPADRPFQCWDSSCRRVPCDCPPPPTCTADAPYLCASIGKCVADLRAECPIGDVCPVETPVRCEDRSCQASAADCPTTGAGCAGVICHDGACRESAAECPVVNCPRQAPVRCANQQCVVSADACPLDNGCPAAAAVRCWNGECVSSASECSAEVACSDGNVRCPDGGCAASAGECPEANGCPSGAPVLCADRVTCATDAASCFLTDVCGPAKPHRCPNGLCVGSSVDCPVQNNALGRVCQAPTPVFCASGACAATSKECPIVKPCPADRPDRCGDGTCRADGANACPPASTCPAIMPFRCQNGLCAASESECRAESGCPGNRPVKCSSGLCATDVSECDAGVFGCPTSASFSCWNGVCAASEDECPARNGCPFDAPTRCPNGACAASLNECSDETECPSATPVRCEADQSCAATASDCSSVNGCPIALPMRCANGSCVESVRDCPAATLCDDDLPVLCADGSCQFSADLCPPVDPCDADSVRCPDLTCAATLDECSTGCPPAAPIWCVSPTGTVAGVCVSEAADCPAPVCDSTPETPFMCLDGTCQANPAECSTGVECTDADEPFLCWDGSCAASNALCPVMSNCPIDLPRRCPNGACVEDATECDDVDACAAGLERCPDGVCRPIGACVYNGCGLDAPVTCPNGDCALNMTMCSGACAPDSFPCLAGGACTNDTSLCAVPAHHQKPLPMTFTSDCLSDAILPVVDSTGIAVAELIIPAGAFDCSFGPAKLDLGGLDDTQASQYSIPGDGRNASNAVGFGGVHGAVLGADLRELSHTFNVPLTMCFVLTPGTNVDDICLSFANEVTGEWECGCTDPELDASGTKACCEIEHFSSWTASDSCNGDVDCCGVCNGDGSSCQCPDDYTPTINVITAEDIIALKCLANPIDCPGNIAALIIVVVLIVLFAILFVLAVRKDRLQRRAIMDEIRRVGGTQALVPAVLHSMGGKYAAKGVMALRRSSQDDEVEMQPMPGSGAGLGIVDDSFQRPAEHGDDASGMPALKSVDDGNVDEFTSLLFTREVRPEASPEDRGWTLYRKKVVHGLKHDHSWFSVAFAKATDKFTRAQRLMVLLTVIAFSFAVNAFFYRANATLVQALIQAALASVTAMPVCGLSTFLFKQRKIKPGSELALIVDKAEELQRQVWAAEDAVEAAEKAEAALGGGVRAAASLEGGDDDTPQSSRSKGSNAWTEETDKEKKKRLRNEKREAMEKKRRRKLAGGKKRLPWWTVYVAWTYSVLICLGSFFCIVVYGVDFGTDANRSWLTSSSWSVGQDFIVNDGIKIVVKALVSVFAGSFGAWLDFVFISKL